MKQLTKKQRNKIYLRSYKILYNSDHKEFPSVSYICEAFGCVITRSKRSWIWNETNEWINILPEFGLFNPKKTNDGHGWFGLPLEDNNKNERLTALAFMIAMTEDKQ